MAQQGSWVTWGVRPVLHVINHMQRGPQVPTQSFLGHAIQVAQTARALHWIVTTLKDSGLGSEAGVLTLGE